MTLSKVISDVKKWSIKEQSEFCRFISQNITVAIRSIYSRPNKTDKEKLEAVRWINEFHHRINNIKFRIEKVISKEDNIESISGHIKFYANQNQILKGELSEVLRLSYEAAARNIEHKRRFTVHGHGSIFELIESENFRKRTAMYVGSNKIKPIRNFIDGYYYALDCKDIHMRTDINFREFHDWTSNYFGRGKSAKGWTTIILEEVNGDEEQALRLFFEVYDKFKESQIGERQEDE